MLCGFYSVKKVLIAGVLSLLVVLTARAADTVDTVMDNVITRFYASMPMEELYALDNAKVMTLLTPDELAVLATKHLSFTADMPVVVSILRDVKQEVIPFWLEPAGFKKTDLTARNMEDWQYEVWQKEFPAGKVELGINGFEYHRPHYLVSVGAKDSSKKVTISNLSPDRFPIVETKVGALCYNDWTELVLTEVPVALVGQQLLTTIRGRGRESHLVGGFRQTKFPATERPSPVYLTWSDDPKTTQTVNWRTKDTVSDGVIRYWKQGDSTKHEIDVAPVRMEDRMLANDRYCHWYTGLIAGLEPGTTYEYQAGVREKDLWSTPAAFTTAPANPAKFSFFHCSDTHSNEHWGKLLRDTFKAYPDTSFCLISGDLVRTGMERQDYDETLAYGEAMYRTRPVMPAIGNHDAQLGFPPDIYLEVFGLPENGPEGIRPERAYTFRYGNAEFFVLDVMSPTGLQGEWLREKLAQSTATWKIALFHFPMYTREDQPSALQKYWATAFDEYHVDVVLTGHIHTHTRTYPVKGGSVVDSPADGTVYVTAISIPGREFDSDRPKPALVEAWVGGGLMCDRYEIDGNKLTMQAIGVDGSVKDSFVIEKEN
ncbi:MAG: hypothetical protein AMXMBFR84_15640 [Candidatus Hydrogenedentota bacterium]